jgi:small-conductance mechanosensitive channel
MRGGALQRSDIGSVFDLRFSAGLSKKPRKLMQNDDSFYAASERRIEYLTIAIGALATIAATVLWNWRAGAAVASGAILSWINYRWLKQGIATLARLSTAQAGAEKARVPPTVYLKFLGRYALLIVAAYAILRGFKLPAASLLAGFFAVIAAVILELIGQLFRSEPEPREHT